MNHLFRWRNTVGLLIFAIGYGTTIPLTDWLGGGELKSFSEYVELPVLGVLVLVPIGIWMDRRAGR